MFHFPLSHHPIVSVVISSALMPCQGDQEASCEFIGIKGLQLPLDCSTFIAQFVISLPLLCCLLRGRLEINVAGSFITGPNHYHQFNITKHASWVLPISQSQTRYSVVTIGYWSPITPTNLVLMPGNSSPYDLFDFLTTWKLPASSLEVIRDPF